MSSSRRNGSVSRAAEAASKNRLHMDRNPQHSRITDPSNPAGRRKEIDNVMKRARQASPGSWDRKLLEVEEKDPNRWRHTGYKQMYLDGSGSGSPRRSRSPVLSRRSRSPVLGRRSRSPVLGRRSRSPVLGRRSRSPVLRRSRSPVLGRRSRSPVLGRRSRSPVIGRRSRSPVIGRRSRSPVSLRRSRSPVRRSRSPRRETRRTPPRRSSSPRRRSPVRSRRPRPPPRPQPPTPTDPRKSSSGSSASSCSDESCSVCSAKNKKTAPVASKAKIPSRLKSTSPSRVKSSAARAVQPTRELLKARESSKRSREEKVLEWQRTQLSRAPVTIPAVTIKREGGAPTDPRRRSPPAARVSPAALAAALRRPEPADAPPQRMTLSDRFGKMAAWSAARAPAIDNMRITRREATLHVHIDPPLEAPTRPDGAFPEELAAAAPHGTRAWDDVTVRYDYYKKRGYLRGLTLADYVKWEEWWYKYQEWLERERAYERWAEGEVRPRRERRRKGARHRRP